MTDVQEWFEQVQRDAAKDTIARMFARRLGRALGDGERRVLTDRIDRLGEDRVEDVLLTLDAGAIAAWLADPVAS